MISGLVLAAGQSERMGEPKAMLELDGRTFLEAAVTALREGGCGDVLVAVGSPNTAFAARSAGARIVQGDPQGEQIDSLRSGLEELADTDADAVVVLPVDHPGVRADTVAAVIGAWRDDPGAIVRPVHDGEPGHPTLFPRGTWPALRTRELDRGARSVVEAGRTVDVPVDDPAVIADIDTPADYDRHTGGE